MRRIIYGGTSLFTGDRIADAILDYGAALAGASQAAVIAFPGRDEGGELRELRLLLGPASQMVSEGIDVEWPEILSPETVDRLEGLTSGLTSPEFALPTFGDDDGADTDR
ncbi:hypothetical protein [Leifsonia aquatica]|uniref:hypothetical protein n=1 Tax=Leifsonia aquatica TaxID=144185 RepID=UPI00046ABCB3|nr:hypothetical protein [Leifsonia aquatica]